MVRANNVGYIASLTCEAFLMEYFHQCCINLGINTLRLPKNMRIVRRGQHVFIFNYASYSQVLPIVSAGDFVLGNAQLQPFDVAIIKLTAIINLAFSTYI